MYISSFLKAFDPHTRLPESHDKTHTTASKRGLETAQAPVHAASAAACVCRPHCRRMQSGGSCGAADPTLADKG